MQGTSSMSRAIGGSQLARRHGGRCRAHVKSGSASSEYNLKRRESLMTFLSWTVTLPALAEENLETISTVSVSDSGDVGGLIPRESSSELQSSGESSGSLSSVVTESLDKTKMEKLVESILSYEFEYPVTTSSGRSISLVFSRKPEKYSSAAPLTPDARQRIVAELVDLKLAVTISVTVGPPAGTLKTVPEAEWTPNQVAEQVLADRSTARVTSGQRVSLGSVENASSIDKNGRRYYVYEHISQGSPNIYSQTNQTYRHALAVTVSRPGLDGSPYLYTLNVSAPQEIWDDIEEGFQRAVNSFQLLVPGRDYIAPDQDPWRFF